jgi:hypothetical protein
MQNLVANSIGLPEVNQFLTLGLQGGDPEVGDAFEELRRSAELLRRCYRQCARFPSRGLLVSS